MSMRHGGALRVTRNELVETSMRRAVGVAGARHEVGVDGGGPAEADP